MVPKGDPSCGRGRQGSRERRGSGVKCSCPGTDDTPAGKAGSRRRGRPPSSAARQPAKGTKIFTFGERHAYASGVFAGCSFNEGARERVERMPFVRASGSRTSKCQVSRTQSAQRGLGEAVLMETVDGRRQTSLRVHSGTGPPFRAPQAPLPGHEGSVALGIPVFQSLAPANARHDTERGDGWDRLESGEDWNQQRRHPGPQGGAGANWDTVARDFYAGQQRKDFDQQEKLQPMMSPMERASAEKASDLPCTAVDVRIGDGPCSDLDFLLSFEDPTDGIELPTVFGDEALSFASQTMQVCGQYAGRPPVADGQTGAGASQQQHSEAHVGSFLGDANRVLGCASTQGAVTEAILPPLEDLLGQENSGECAALHGREQHQPSSCSDKAEPSDYCGSLGLWSSADAVLGCDPQPCESLPDNQRTVEPSELIGKQRQLLGAANSDRGHTVPVAQMRVEPLQDLSFNRALTGRTCSPGRWTQPGKENLPGPSSCVGLMPQDKMSGTSQQSLLGPMLLRTLQDLQEWLDSPPRMRPDQWKEVEDDAGHGMSSRLKRARHSPTCKVGDREDILQVVGQEPLELRTLSGKGNYEAPMDVHHGEHCGSDFGQMYVECHAEVHAGSQQSLSSAYPARCCEAGQNGILSSGHTNAAADDESGNSTTRSGENVPCRRMQQSSVEAGFSKECAAAGRPVDGDMLLDGGHRSSTTDKDVDHKVLDAGNIGNVLVAEGQVGKQQLAMAESAGERMDSNMSREMSKAPTLASIRLAQGVDNMCENASQAPLKQPESKVLGFTVSDGGLDCSPDGAPGVLTPQQSSFQDETLSADVKSKGALFASKEGQEISPHIEGMAMEQYQCREEQGHISRDAHATLLHPVCPLPEVPKRVQNEEYTVVHPIPASQPPLHGLGSPKTPVKIGKDGQPVHVLGYIPTPGKELHMSEEKSCEGQGGKIASHDCSCNDEHSGMVSFFCKLQDHFTRCSMSASESSRRNMLDTSTKRGADLLDCGGQGNDGIPANSDGDEYGESRAVSCSVCNSKDSRHFSLKGHPNVESRTGNASLCNNAEVDKSGECSECSGEDCVYAMAHCCHVAAAPFGQEYGHMVPQRTGNENRTHQKTEGLCASEPARVGSMDNSSQAAAVKYWGMEADGNLQVALDHIPCGSKTSMAVQQGTTGRPQLNVTSGTIAKHSSALDFFSPHFDALLALSTEGCQPPDGSVAPLESLWTCRSLLRRWCDL